MTSFLGRLSQTIVGRMLLYMVAPTVAIFVIVIIVAIRSAYTNLRQAAENHLETRASLVASTVEHLQDQAALTARNMAEAQTAGMFGDRKTSLEFARRVLADSPSLTGTYFAYEPTADKKAAADGKPLPPESMDKSGRFVPYWSAISGKGRTLQLERLADLETHFNYESVKDHFLKTRKVEAWISEPYSNQDNVVVQHIYPIVIDGNFSGIAGVDFSLTDIEFRLRRIASQADLDLFLVSSGGHFILATTDRSNDASSHLKTEPVDKTPYATLFSPLLHRQGHSELRLEPDPTDKQNYYFMSLPIGTGDWTLVVRQSESKVLSPIRSTLVFRLTVALLGLVAMVALWLTLTIRLSRRINLAVAAAEQVAEGDLTREIVDDRSQDETGLLLRALRTMTHNLNNIVGNVKRASVQLNSTATELAATSHEQESTARSFAATTNEIAAAAKQISATSGELVTTMHEVSDAAIGTARLANEGRSGLQAMEGNMRSLEQATASIGDKLATINERASNITGIITTITKVADQTNLLSVNAAIEAEKAGEYGVGFLVVAREIRRLADQTASATLDIQQMVQQMHAAVSAGVMEMDHFTDQVRRSVTDVGSITGKIEGIIQRVGANTDRFERVHESMQSQAQGAEQISDAMASLTETASQTTEAAAEYSRAATGLREAIASLQSSIATFQLQTWCPITPEEPTIDGQ